MIQKLLLFLENMVCSQCGGRLGYKQWWDSNHSYRVCQNCGHFEEEFEGNN